MKLKAKLFRLQSLMFFVIAGIIAFTAVPLFTGCEFPVPEEEKYPVITPLNDYLVNQPDNTKDTPYNYKLDINSDDLIKLKNTLRQNPKKYVNIDLSDSTITEFPKNAFYYCFTLAEITIPKNMTSIGDYAFYCCGLTNINIPNNVTSIGKWAFGSRQLNSVTIGKGVASIGDYAFYYCYLTNITIPDNVTIIGNNVFNNCTNLNSVTIGKGVTSIGDYAFEACYELTAINIDDNNNNYSSENGVFYNKDKTTLIKYPSGKTDAYFTIPNSVINIEEMAFFNCKNLTDVIIGNNVTSIKDWAFTLSYNLVNVTMGNKVTSIGSYAFAICNSLAAITIPNNITSIKEEAFNHCNFADVIIPNSVKSIERRAFDDCNNLTSVTFEGTINSNNFDTYQTFPGDLRAKFYETNPNNGTPGTYTRENGSNTWTKQP